MTLKKFRWGEHFSILNSGTFLVDISFSCVRSDPIQTTKQIIKMNIILSRMDGPRN